MTFSVSPACRKQLIQADVNHDARHAPEKDAHYLRRNHPCVACQEQPNRKAEKVPKYELGKVQWRLEKEERKRQKKAALASKIENERAFYVGLGLMEKQQRIGEATGLNKRKGGKMSLFDVAQAFPG